MQLKLSTLLVATGLLVLRSTAWDWPEFRGPTAQGLIGGSNWPVTWNAATNVAWKQAVPGQGWSSPVLEAGRLYLTTAIPGGSSEGALSLRVLCLQASTGQTLWNKEVFAPTAKRVTSIHSKNSQASATPLIEDKKLFVHFGHLGTACLDLDGNVVWKNEKISYPPVHGNGGSPVIAEGRLIFNCDGAKDPFVVGLDAATGRESWRTARQSKAKKSFSFCTPIMVQVGDQDQVITPGSGHVSALDPKTGNEIWRVRYGEGYSVVPRPVYSQKHKLLFLSSGFDRPVLLAIRPDGKGDVTETHVAWQSAKGAPTTPSPLLVDEELYTVSDGGIASCFDARSGRVHWQERVGGNYSASPVYADGYIYFQNEEGTCVVVKAGTSFEKVAENDLGERTLASFAADAGAFYIRTEGSLFKISKQ